MEATPLWRGANVLYKGQTYANAALSGAVLRAAYKLYGWTSSPPPAEALADLQQRLEDLMEADWKYARAGYYPMRELFSSPLLKHGRQLPRIAREAPKIARRKKTRAYDELPPEIDRSKYPKYYLRTFHWQTDGWFSARSAELYDATVEVLFGGTGDMMRRMAIPPLVDGVRDVARPSILDVACGTGGFLSQLKTALPGASLYGLDLSEAYLDHARDRHGDAAHFIWGNAEALPFADGSFDAVSCVFTFHELPRAVRPRVMAELARVVRPGGRVVVNDSAQLVESRKIAFFLERFPDVYHEPYYRNYLEDDLEPIVEGAGLTLLSSAPFAVSKVVVGEKPRTH